MHRALCAGRVISGVRRTFPFAHIKAGFIIGPPEGPMTSKMVQASSGEEPEQSDFSEPKIAPSLIRKRIEIEDGLLNTRTGVFLAVSGLLAAAVGASSNLLLQKALSSFGIGFSFLWFVCSLQSWLVISRLTQILRTECSRLVEARSEGEVLIEGIIQTVLKPFRWFGLRPTNILVWWLPLLLLVSWAVLLIKVFR